MSTAAQTAAAGGTTPDVDALPAAVVQAPFAEADAWLGGETASDANSLIAPTRCTWAVTVHAPFTPRSVPYGKKAISYDSYTVLFDRNSGQYLGVSAGTDAADLITGDRAGR